MKYTLALTVLFGTLWYSCGNLTSELSFCYIVSIRAIRNPHPMNLDQPRSKMCLGLVPALLSQKARLLACLATTLTFTSSVLLFNPPALAQRGAQTAPTDLGHMVQSAGTILRGHVIFATVEAHPQFANLQTVVVTISVVKVLKGEAANTYTFRQFVWDARDVPDAAGYRKSGELLLFLNPVSPYGLTSPVGLDQGRFRIVRDMKGRAFALNGRDNFGLFEQVLSKATSRGVIFSQQTQAMMVKPGGKAPLESLEDAITTLVGASK